MLTDMHVLVPFRHFNSWRGCVAPVSLIKMAFFLKILAFESLSFFSFFCYPKVNRFYGTFRSLKWHKEAITINLYGKYF